MNSQPPLDPLPAIDRWTAFYRGATGHCPRCDARDLFRTHYRLHERCPQCDLPIEMEDGWSYGSVPLAYMLACLFWTFPVSAFAVLGWISFSTAVIVGVIGVIILPVITFRFTKQLWIGLYYSLIPHEMRYRSPDEKGDVH